MSGCEGFVDSIWNGSAVDGEGLRCVIFLSGCNLRCPFCHNPETLYGRGRPESVETLVGRVLRFRPYFGTRGGATLSGGEPLLQEPFAYALLTAFREAGIHTCIETNGRLESARVYAACDSIILDVKNQFDSYDYAPLLSRLDAQGARVFLTNVLVPGVNDDAGRIAALGALAEEHSSVAGVRFLPFHKLCVEKYEKLGRPFPAADWRVPTEEESAAAAAALRRVTRKA